MLILFFSFYVGYKIRDLPNSLFCICNNLTENRKNSRVMKTSSPK